jgi:hypothetical protein
VIEPSGAAMADILSFATFLICDICVKIFRKFMLTSCPIISIEIRKYGGGCFDIAANDGHCVPATKLHLTAAWVTGKDGESIADSCDLLSMNNRIACFSSI